MREGGERTRQDTVGGSVRVDGQRLHWTGRGDCAIFREGERGRNCVVGEGGVRYSGGVKKEFWNKMAERLDRMDADSVQAQFVRLAGERGRMERIFDALREGVLVLDGEGRVVFANRSAGTLLDTEAGALRGRILKGRVAGVDWDEVLSGGAEEGGSRELEVGFPKPRWLSVYLSPLDGEGMTLILRDATQERERTSEAVESERLNAVLMLAAEVAHEIGNPLNSLGIHLQLMQRKVRQLEGAEGLERSLEVARGEIGRLDQILKQFLNAVRPSAPQMGKHALKELAEETLEALGAEIADRGIRVESEEGEGAPAAWVDGGQVRQALYNVMRNAIQAMPEGGVLRVGYAWGERWVGVWVEDTGSGIPAERLGELFEPFKTTKSGGHGLGLMIVQRIVRDHGGTVTVDRLRGGTRIQLNFRREDDRVRLLPEGGGA